MATIRDLIVRVGVDASQVSRGVQESIAQLDRVTRAAADASRATTVNVNAEIGAFERLATVVGVNARQLENMRGRADNLAASLARLGATDRQINRIGAAVDRAERSFGEAALGGAIAQATTRTTGLGRALDSLHGSPMIGISELARGLGNVARQGEVGALAMREFTGAGFRLASFLGPLGPLIPIVGVLGYAFYEMFAGARAEAEKTRKKFEEEFNRMRDALDQSGLREQLKSIEIGKPSAGVGEGAGFAGSIRDLVARRNAIVAQIADIRTQLDDTQNEHLKRILQVRIDVLERYWRNLGKQLAPLREQQKNLRDALINPTIEPGQTTTPTKLESKTQVDSLQKVIEEQGKAAERLAAIYTTLNARQQQSATVSDALLRSYDNIAHTLTRLHNEGRTVFDPLVESMLKAQQALEKTDLIQALRLGKLPALAVPGLVTQPGARPFAGATSQLGPDITGAFLRALQQAGGVRGAAQPVIDAGRLTNMIGPELAATFRELGTNIKSTLTGTLIAAFGPVAILMRALEPAIRALTPLFDRLAVPIAIVARILAATLEPTLRALWPILRALGVAATLVGEVMARISAAIAQAVGGLIKAIGNLISKIPGLGGVGRSIANFGQSMLNFAEGQKQAAAQFAQARKELQGMTWDQTAQALENLQGAAQNAADELRNIPTGFRIQRAIFLASRPVNAADVGAGASSSVAGTSNYFAPGSIVINTQRPSGDELLDEVSRAAREKNMARVGTTANAGDVLG